MSLYGASYGNFATRVYAEVRAEAFGEDIGQTSWLTAGEHDRLLAWLALDASHRLLDVACGSGGPSIRACERSGASVVGIDVRSDAIATAARQTIDRCTFLQVDASGELPFPDASFDGLICVDAINHLADRARVLAEWRRVLKPSGRLAFTDPIVITGAISAEEIRIRSSIGHYDFVPPGHDEALLARAGFAVAEVVDCTENMAVLAGRWRDARAARGLELQQIEGADAYAHQQTFLDVSARLAADRRLSRFAILATIR